MTTIAKLLALTVGIIATLFIAPTHATAVAPERSVRLEAPVKRVDERRVTYVERLDSGRYWIELNNGALWRMVQCRTEASRNCVWPADRRGNGIGRSFANLQGERLYFASHRGSVKAVRTKVVTCAQELTVYEVELRNTTAMAKRFRAFEVVRGKKIEDQQYTVAHKSSTGLMFYVPSGKRLTVTVTQNNRVLLHEGMKGICY